MTKYLAELLNSQPFELYVDLEDPALEQFSLAKGFILQESISIVYYEYDQDQANRETAQQLKQEIRQSEKNLTPGTFTGAIPS